MKQIKWHRPNFDTETGRSIYEDSTGRFEIWFRADDDSGYGSCWYAKERDGSICYLDPETYLADMRANCEDEIRAQA